LLFGFQALQQDFGLGDPKVAGTSIPGQSGAQISARTAQAGPVEEVRVESLPQSERRLAFSGIGGALVNESRRNQIAPTEERIPSRQQRCEVRGGEAKPG
jgi:hypothetical protein